MDSKRNLAIALLLVGVIFGVELVGSFLSNSLALFSDAGHMLTDAMALALALLAAAFSSRRPSKFRTFGFYRLEILSALLNGSLLVFISLYIFYQAYQRFIHPAEVQSGIMLLVATVGLLANIGAAVILVESSKENLNVRGAFLHVLSDLGASVAVIAGGVIIQLTRWYYIDPIIGILIGLLILRGALMLVAESANILLEAAPKGVDADEVAAVIKKVDGVRGIHDLHVWSITSGLNAIAAHLLIEDDQLKRASEILAEINQRLKDKYQIAHSTFQTECESCPEGLICYIGPVNRMEHEHPR